MIDRLKMMIPISFLILVILVVYIGFKFFLLNSSDNNYMTTPFIGKGVSKDQHWIKCDLTINGYCFGWKEDIPEEMKVKEKAQ
jgi:hypothetical protein